LRGFDAKNLPSGPAVERFFPSKVPLFSDKSHTGERQKCHSQDASVALLTCKSATLAIQNLEFRIVSAAKSLQSSDLRRRWLEGDIFARVPFFPRRRDSGGGYFC